MAKNVNNVITKYLYDNEDSLLETDNNDNVTARYTHGPGIDEPLIMQRGSFSYYYITDGLGSVVKIIDGSGNVVNNYVYNSFGNITSKNEAVPNFYTYTRREFDSESGLYYYRVRYYDARIGRFINEDPIGFNGGINYFIYTENNPVNFIDPSGLDFITIKEAQKLIEEFKTWLGTPYSPGGIEKGLYGGTDCSHSTNEGYKNAGFPYKYSKTLNFSKTTSFKPIPGKELQIGDVALWKGHMAVYAGDGKIYTAHHSGGAPYSIDKLSGWIKSKGSNPVWYRYYKPD